MDELSLKTRQRVFAAMVDLGCQPVINGDGNIEVQFQGEAFIMECFKYYVNVWDLSWSHVNINDINLPLVKEAMNIANFHNGPAIVMTSATEEGYRYLHTHDTWVIHENFVNLEGFIKASLMEFLNLKQEMFMEFNKLKSQIESQKESDDKGDATGMDSPEGRLEQPNQN